MSSKRTVKRYEFASNRIGYCAIETAGNMDMDVELKFSIGEAHFSIDVRKNFIEQVKDIYKALIAIGRQQSRDATGRDNALRTLEAMGGMLKLGNLQGEAAVIAHFNAVLDNLNTAMLDRHTTRDYSRVFEKFIHNIGTPPAQP